MDADAMDTCSPVLHCPDPGHEREPLVPGPEHDRRPDPFRARQGCRKARAKGLRTGPLRCACGGAVQWAKIDFIRPDGYRDWRLDVWCAECGAIRDPEILAAVRGIHLEEVIRAIHREMDRILAPDLNNFLDSYLADLRARGAR